MSPPSDDNTHGPVAQDIRAPLLPAGTPFLTRGVATPSPVRASAVPPVRASAPGASRRPRVVCGETFLAETENHVQTWWWDGIIPATGITLFAGNPLSFKSVLLLSASIAARGHASITDSAASGVRVGGRYVRPARVLYVKLEHLDASYAEIIRRARRTYAAPDLTNFHLVRELSLESNESIAAIDDWAEDIDAQVVIVDSLRRAHSGDENSSQEVAVVMSALQRLTAGGRRAVIVVHHLTRNTREIRGSTDFLAGADAEVRVMRSPGTDQVTLEARSHGGADGTFRMRVNFSDDRILVAPADEAETDRRDDDELRRAILQACTPEPMTTTRLRVAVRGILVRVQNDRIDAMVLQLEREGLVRDAPGFGRGHHWMAVPAAASSSSPLRPPR